MRNLLVTVLLIALSSTDVCAGFFPRETPPDLSGKYGFYLRTSLVNYDAQTNLLVVSSGWWQEIYVRRVEPEHFPMFTLGWTYIINGQFSVQVEAGIGSGGIIMDPGSVHLGELWQFPLLASVRWYAPAGSQVSTYILAGGGYLLNHFSADNKLSVPGSYDDAASGAKDSFEKHIGVGIEYFIQDDATISIQVLRVWTEVGVRYGGADAPYRNYAVNPWLFSVSVSQYF